jgi:hypothetical protein
VLEKWALAFGLWLAAFGDMGEIHLVDQRI